MGDQRSQFNKQNTKQGTLNVPNNSSKVVQGSQTSQGNNSQADPHEQQNTSVYSQLSQNNNEERNSYDNEVDSKYNTKGEIDNKTTGQLNLTEDGELVSPLAGIIRRGSIGGTGEKGLTHSITPNAVENTPFMGKKGGGKIPLVGEIRRGSISGIGERGYAISSVAKDEVPLKAMKYGSLGIHRPREKDKYNLRRKSKKNVAISGSKFGGVKNAYYMKMHNINATKINTRPYFGSGKAPSLIGYTNNHSIDKQSSTVGSFVRSSNTAPITNTNDSNISGSHFISNSATGGGGGGGGGNEERNADQRGRSGRNGSRSTRNIKK